jgi:membrane fusion protein (multidrug efflux system)
MRKKHIVAIIGLLTVCFTAGLLLFPQLKNGGEENTGYALARTPAKTSVPVAVALAATEPFTEILEALGTAAANESVVITPTLEERVVGIFFEDGDAVDKDQVLVKLDDSETRYLLAEAKAALREQQKQFARISKLAETKSTSRSRLDEEQGLLEIARAKVAHLQAQLRDYTIRAPFAGLLGTRRISTGAVVNSDTVITTLDDTTVIKLDFTVPESYLAVLRNGMDITAQSPAYPNQSFNGTVSAISSRVDPETRSLTVRARIPNPNRLLKPGMLLTVDLIKDRSQALIIPEEAVILEKDKKFALVVTAENTVAKREIVTGRRSPGKVEVISGLSAGQRVIIKGITRVRPGVSVNVVETPPSPGLPG